MKTILGIALVLAAFVRLTSGVRAEGESCDPAIRFEDALPLDFAVGSTPGVDEKMVPGFARSSELVQEIHWALCCIPPHESTRGGECIPQEDPVDDKLKSIHSSLCALIHPDRRIRLQSVKILGEHRFEPATGPLVTLVASDRSPAVREAAAMGIALIGSDSFAVELALRRAAKEDKCPKVRRMARFAAEIIQARREDVPCRLNNQYYLYPGPF